MTRFARDRRPARRRLAWHAALACGGTVAAAATPAWGQDLEREAVIEVVHRLFDGMRRGDTAAMRSVFHETARLVTVGADADTAGLRYSTVDRLVAAVGGSGRVLDERIWDWEVRVSEGAATVWSPYALYVDGEFSHCGIDAVQLAQLAGRWKIVQLMDTRRREGCERPAPSR